jgi:ribosomal protein L13E
VYPTGLNRVQPAQGCSLSELDDAGVDLDLAERLGLPVDAGRIGTYGPNVTRAARFCALLAATDVILFITNLFAGVSFLP